MKSRFHFIQKSALVGVISAMAFLANCTTDDSEDNSALLLAALAATAPNCTVGETQFYASGDVSCADNKATASGVAFLNAASQHTSEFASVGLTVDSITTSVQFFAFRSGRKSEEGNTDSGDSGVVIGPTNVQLYGTGGTNKALAAAATNAGNITGGAQNYCLEVHSDGGEGHIIVDDIACTPTATSGVANTTETGLGSGLTWGFVLNNATISSVSTNSEEQFGD